MGADVENGKSINEHELYVMMRQPSVNLRRAYLKSFVKKYEERDNCVGNIAKTLLRAECWLSEVVSLKNAKLTKAFLKEMDSAIEDDPDCFVPPEIVLSKSLRWKAAFGNASDLTLDGDSQACVEQAMSWLDVAQAEVLLKNGPERDKRVECFFRNIVRLSERRDLKALQVFVGKIVKWKLLDNKSSLLLEEQVFQRAKQSVVQLFTECRVDAHIERLFERNASTALFGNANVNIGFFERLQFNTDARGARGFSALHYAVKNSLLDKVKFLLDYGAEPNSASWSMETPLILSVRESQLDSHRSEHRNESIAELLLQHGADPFFRSWQGDSFVSLVHANHNSSGHLIHLALAYAHICKSAGTFNLPLEYANTLIDLELLARQNSDLFDFYTKCNQQLELLKKDRIRADLTMFTIVSETADKFLRLIDENDWKLISIYIAKYTSEKTLHSYYLNALNEHMRQFRKLLTCQTRVMLAICERIAKPVSCAKILKRIHDKFTNKELLTFQ